MVFGKLENVAYMYCVDEIRNWIGILGELMVGISLFGISIVCELRRSCVELVRVLWEGWGRILQGWEGWGWWFNNCDFWKEIRGSMKYKHDTI